MIQFNEATHTYTKNGVILPSVTEITRFLAYDYKTDRPWLAEEAARRGTAVHEACMLMDYGEEPEELPEIAGYLTAYRRFLADYRPDWTLIEHPMGSVGMGYAGTAGPVRGDAGESSIAGHKSGSMLHHPAVAAQLAGYWWLLLNEGFAADQMMALRLDKSGVYELKEEKDGGTCSKLVRSFMPPQERRGRRNERRTDLVQL